MLIAGVAHLPYWRFLLADGLSAIVSVTIQLAAGYYLAQLSTSQLDTGERWLSLVMLVIGGLLLVGYVVWRLIRGGNRPGRISLSRFGHLRRRNGDGES